MIFSSPPCKDCTERYLRCHSKCPDWEKWKLEEAQKNTKLNESLKSDKVFKEIQSEKSTRIRRRIHSSHLRGYSVR